MWMTETSFVCRYVAITALEHHGMEMIGEMNDHGTAADFIEY
jgi:hypothetical protein